MKKTYLIFIAIIFSCNMWAQQYYEFSNPLSVKSSSIETELEENEIVISFLESDEQINSLGNGSGAGSISGFIELSPRDLRYNKEVNRKLETIKQIQFFISPNHFPAITSGKIIILKGNDINTSTEVANQNIPISELQREWNAIDLPSPYTVEDYEEGLFVGIELNFNKSAFPLGCSGGTHTQQGWIKFNGQYMNIASEKMQVMMKVLFTTNDDFYDTEIRLESSNIPGFSVMEDIPVQGIVRNIGKNPITSFKVLYEVNGETTEEEIKDVNIASTETYTITRLAPFTPEETNIYPYTITISEPNGTEDKADDNSITSTVQTFTKLEPHVVLHEGFSSASCGPCLQGNIDFKKVLDASDPNKFVSIKYQVISPYDPYFTNEGMNRNSYYGISGVPSLVVNGNSFKDHPSNYSTVTLKNIANKMSYVKLTGISGIENQTISLYLTIEPLYNNINTDNLRLFVTIAERTTTKNKRSNGESIFYDVMKKFITSPSGTKLESWELNEPYSMSFKYTFQGEYRLPTNSGNPINHSTEHSVEDFDNLEVIYWIQDSKTKEVYQAGKVYPDPDMVGIKDETGIENGINVFPNPAKDEFTIQTNIDWSKAELINMMGQTVKQIQGGTTSVDATNLSKGVYLLRITSVEGILVQKVQIQ